MQDLWNENKFYSILFYPHLPRQTQKNHNTFTQHTPYHSHY